MRSSTEDKIKGGARALKGKVKEAAGVVTDNRRLRNEGQSEKVAGKVQKKVGQIKRVFED